MGANKLPWEDFLRQRALEAAEREKHSKYRERAEDASVAYKFILSKYARYRRFGGGFSGNPLTRNSIASGLCNTVGPNTPLTRRTTPGRRTTLLDLSSMIPIFNSFAADGDCELKKREDTRFPGLGSIGGQEVNNSADPGGVTPTCSKQSPINLMPHLAVSDTSMGPLNMLYNLHVNYDIINVGYTVAISFRNRKTSFDDQRPSLSNVFESPAELITVSKSYISGGALGSKRFQLIEVWFHWGKDDSRGSEHTVNFKAYPMEVQLVHWNSDEFQSYEEAAGCEHGVVITSVFVQIGRENQGFNSFLEFLEDVHFMMRSKTVCEPHWLNPNCFLPEHDLRDYWYYVGSTTFPPIIDQVEWLVYRYPLTISPNQMAKFRKLRAFTREDLPDFTEGHMCDNFRPCQPIGDRVVKSSFL